MVGSDRGEQRGDGTGECERYDGWREDTVLGGVAHGIIGKKLREKSESGKRNRSPPHRPGARFSPWNAHKMTRWSSTATAAFTFARVTSFPPTAEIGGNEAV